MAERWFIKNKKMNYKYMAQKYGISEVMSKLIVNRDIIDDEMIRSYIFNKDIEKKYVRISREQVGKLLREGFSPICVDENTNEYLFYILCNYNTGVSMSYAIKNMMKNDGFEIFLC